MRPSLMVVCLAAASAVVSGHSDLTRLDSAETPSVVLQRARAVIGGEAKLAAVKSLVMKGEIRTQNAWYRGEPDVRYLDAPLEVRVMMPDHYSWATQVGPSRRQLVVGFRGNVLLTGAPVPDGTADGPYLEHTNLAKLMLALLLRTDTIVPLRLGSGGGAGSTLQFVGPRSFTVYVDLDPSTRLPVRLRHQVQMKTGGNQEVVWSFEDRQVVDGLNLPRRILRSQNNTLRDTLTFETISVNAPLTAADFKSPTE